MSPEECARVHAGHRWPRFNPDDPHANRRCELCGTPLFADQTPEENR